MWNIFIEFIKRNPLWKITKHIHDVCDVILWKKTRIWTKMSFTAMQTGNMQRLNEEIATIHRGNCNRTYWKSLFWQGSPNAKSNVQELISMTNVRAKWTDDLRQCVSWLQTFREEVHQGFNLTPLQIQGTQRQSASVWSLGCPIRFRTISNWSQHIMSLPFQKHRRCIGMPQHLHWAAIWPAVIHTLHNPQEMCLHRLPSFQTLVISVELFCMVVQTTCLLWAQNLPAPFSIFQIESQGLVPEQRIVPNKSPTCLCLNVIRKTLAWRFCEH